MSQYTLLLATLRHLCDLTTQTTRYEQPLLALEGNHLLVGAGPPCCLLTIGGFDSEPSASTYLPSLSLPVLVSAFTRLTNFTGVNVLDSGPFCLLPTKLYLYTQVGVGEAISVEFSSPISWLNTTPIMSKHSKYSTF